MRTPTCKPTCKLFSSVWSPDGDPLFIHTCEGPDDMPAHVKAALMQTSLSIPIADGRPMLGTWQGIYLFEHRQRPHDRQIVLHVSGVTSGQASTGANERTRTDFS